jgi:hypothetical protein
MEVAMKKPIIGLALALALAASSCARDVTASDEYQAVEPEVAALEQQLSAGVSSISAGLWQQTVWSRSPRPG